MQCNKARFTALAQRFEKDGCVIEEREECRGQRSFLVFVPGADKGCVLPMGLGATLQKQFWNQVEFRLDQASGEIHSRWNYFSRGNLFLHGSVSLMVMLCLAGKVEATDGILALAMANGVLMIASYIETLKVRHWAKDHRHLSPSPSTDFEN